MNIILMPFSLVKAIKNTHRNPINLFLHFIGVSLYIVGLFLVVGFVSGMYINPIEGTILWISILWSIAVVLFVVGHKIEGNLKATTPVVVFKYIMSKL